MTYAKSGISNLFYTLARLLSYAEGDRLARSAITRLNKPAVVAQAELLRLGAGVIYRLTE